MYECSFWTAADYEMARQNVPICILFNNTNTNRGGCQHYLSQKRFLLLGRVFDTHQQTHQAALQMEKVWLQFSNSSTPYSVHISQLTLQVARVPNDHHQPDKKNIN
jgi:hypothetical protein